MTGEDGGTTCGCLSRTCRTRRTCRVADIPEPVHTVETLSRTVQVSTKTISRWREQGLVSRRFIFEGPEAGRISAEQRDRFVACNAMRVRRGERFSQLTDPGAERDRANGPAVWRGPGPGQSEVTRRIARHMNRSVETIRYTLKQFDREHPDLAVFPRPHGPLTEDLKRKIYQEYRRGAPVAELAERFGRTRTTIYRVINEIRARRILELPLDYVYNESLRCPRMPTP